jgi:hypothetical protein
VLTPLALRSTKNKAIWPFTVAGTTKASAWSPMATTLLVPLTVHVPPDSVATAAQRFSW